jgi:hypothetical protein
MQVSKEFRPLDIEERTRFMGILKWRCKMGEFKSKMEEKR